MRVRRTLHLSLSTCSQNRAHEWRSATRDLEDQAKSLQDQVPQASPCWNLIDVSDETKRRASRQRECAQTAPNSYSFSDMNVDQAALVGTRTSRYVRSGPRFDANGRSTLFSAFFSWHPRRYSTIGG